MSCAINEIAALTKRATRGAGLSWGFAEEAGWATGWLCTRGFDGTIALADILSQQPTPEICPLTQGTALSDRAVKLAQAPVTFAQIAQPVLLLPFIAAAARQTGSCFALQSASFSICTDGEYLSRSGADPLPALGYDITLRAVEHAVEPSAVHRRFTPDAEAWQSLNRFAHKTYAPATEASRRLGAGSDLSDND